MHDERLSRRDALKRATGALLTVASGSALGCRKADFACVDTSGLTAEELKLRNDCEYVDRSPDPRKVCSNCVQYIDAKASGTCGGCKLLKGPFHPDGYCKAYAAKG